MLKTTMISAEHELFRPRLASSFSQSFLLICLLLIGFAPSSLFACENKPFIAVCKNTDTHSFFGHRTDMNGRLMADEWVANDLYRDAWIFQFDGVNSLLVDGKLTPIVAQACGSLVASLAWTNGSAVSVWSYAFNLTTRGALASLINSHDDFLGAGMKAKALQLECEFKFL